MDTEVRLITEDCMSPKVLESVRGSERCLLPNNIPLKPDASQPFKRVDGGGSAKKSVVASSFNVTEDTSSEEEDRRNMFETKPWFRPQSLDEKNALFEEIKRKSTEEDVLKQNNNNDAVSEE